MRTIFGRYVLEREVGRGATGSVWLADDSRLQRRVAVKLLRPDCLERPSLRARFEREALTIAQLRSPYIVHVYDTGVEEGQPFIVMEWLDGQTLEDLLAKRVRMSLAETVSPIVRLARALSLTHAAQIVHLDIKPANIFVSQDADEIVPKLLDFGVANWLTPQPFSPSGGAPVIAGTPHYMSPEQVSVRQPDGRSDLWSLGVVAYTMLTGRLPFDAEDFATLREKICGEAHAPASSHAPELAPSIDDFFTKALAKDPRARFQNATEVAAAFLRAAQMPAPAPINILLLDDEPDMEILFRAGFRRELKEKRYEITFATDGRAGLDILRSRSDIDVVLTDINMPGMGGLTFLAHVGQMDPTLRVVVVSAYNDFTNLRTAMNHGAFDFVVKPFNGFDDLRVTIEKCASHVAVLRQGVRTKRENDLLRMLVGRPGTAEGASSNVPVLDEGPTEGSVAFLGLESQTAELAADDHRTAISSLQGFLTHAMSKLMAGDAPVVRFAGGCLMLVFRGDRHAERAVEVCLAMRDRAVNLAGEASSHPLAGLTMGIEAGPLLITRVGRGSVETNEDPVIFGEPVARAAALQIAAQDGEILVASSLKGMLDDTFLLRQVPHARTGRPQSPVFAVVERAKPSSNVETIEVLKGSVAASGPRLA